jgi:hypothetical protein
MQILLAAIHLAALPLAYLFWVTFLFATDRRKGLVVSLALFVAAVIVGAWSISRSHGSGGALGFLILPYVATAAGALGIAFGYGWKSGRRWPRIGGRIALSLAVVLIALEAVLVK